MEVDVNEDEDKNTVSETTKIVKGLTYMSVIFVNDTIFFRTT